MKKLLLILTGVLIAFVVYSQAPQAFKYQAVIRDNSGNLMTDQSIDFQVDILQGTVDGTVVYSETHSALSNAYGLVNLAIGSGTTTDEFSEIDWGADSYFIKLSVNGDEMGTSQLLSVPYALYAETAENVNVPIYTTAEITVLTPGEGDVLYNISESLYQIYIGSSWISFSGSCWPEPTVANAGDDQYLTDGTVTLSANAPETNHGTGTWSIITGTGGGFTDADNPNTTFTGQPDIIYILRWTITTECNSSYDDITINPIIPTVIILASVDGYQVAFTATATNADTYAWDFGDGETSTEQNPVYIYAQSGTYTATVTVTGEGGTADASVEVTIVASELEMLTGGSAMVNGKTWVFSPVGSVGDGIFYADADMILQEPIPDGILGLIGLPSEYEDEFTFKYDMSYTHDVKNDSSVTDIIYALINVIEFRQSAGDIIVLAPFTPEAATFTYTEETDLTLTVVDKNDDEVTLDVTWSNVDVLKIEGGTEFVGIQDFTRKYIVFDMSVDHLQIGMFISASEGSNMNYPSHILIMTLVPKW